MKRILFAAAALVILGGIAYCLVRTQTPASTADPGMPAGTGPGSVSPAKPAQPARRNAAPQSADNSATAHPQPAGPVDFTATPSINDVLEILVSPGIPLDRKETAWREIGDTNRMDEAIAELERRTESDPAVPEYLSALGQAYLRRSGMTQDIREQGILALKADQAFDAALALDGSNWEARFTKAVAMSYWPPMLNKSEEVVQHFRTLIAQQEGHPQQPHFALSYSWLGDQYAKAGKPDEARQIWQAGAERFPENQELKGKLAAR